MCPAFVVSQKALVPEQMYKKATCVKVSGDGEAQKIQQFSIYNPRGQLVLPGTIIPRRSVWVPCMKQAGWCCKPPVEYIVNIINAATLCGPHKKVMGLRNTDPIEETAGATYSCMNIYVSNVMQV
jgi:hypothetical protein